MQPSCWPLLDSSECRVGSSGGEEGEKSVSTGAWDGQRVVALLQYCFYMEWMMETSHNPKLGTKQT